MRSASAIRTLYRDITSLQALAAAIEGKPGVGYILKPGFLLPHLMFTPEEIEALVLGSRWVADRADDRLRDAARSALTRIAAVLPADLGDELDASALLISSGAAIPADGVDLALLCKVIRTERKLSLRYRDGAGAASERIVWPFALAFSILCACCWYGANHVRASGTSAPIGSFQRHRSRRGIRSDVRRC